MASNKENKVFDVANPGSADAHPNARPVIVPRRTLLRDPMMASGNKPIKDAVSPEDQKDKEEKLSETASKEVKPPETKDKSPQPSTEEADKETPEEEEKPAEADDSITEPAADEDSDESKEEEKNELTADKQLDEKYEKLIEDKKYFVPIGAVKRRRNMRAALITLLFVIVAALVAVNFLADAGIIQLPVQPFTDIIKNNP